MSQASDEAKALLAGKPYMKGFRIFKYTKTYAGEKGRVIQHFFLKKRILPLIWADVKYGTGRSRERRTFERMEQIEDYVISVQPPVEKTEEVKL
jgi:hypothetical protein